MTRFGETWKILAKKLAILLSSLSFWKHLEPLWVKKSCLRAYFHYWKWPNIEKNNLAIWSHCASAANANKTTRNCYSVSTELNKIQDVISSLPTLFKDQLYSHSCVWTKTRGWNINDTMIVFPVSVSFHFLPFSVFDHNYSTSAFCSGMKVAFGATPLCRL